MSARSSQLARLVSRNVDIPHQIAGVAPATNQRWSGASPPPQRLRQEAAGQPLDGACERLSEVYRSRPFYRWRRWSIAHGDLDQRRSPRDAVCGFEKLEPRKVTRNLDFARSRWGREEWGENGLSGD